jgi:membrane fusion protein, multidrug efflux system
MIDMPCLYRKTAMAAAMVCLLWATGCSRKTVAQEKRPPVPVVAGRAVVATVPVEVHGFGTVEASAYISVKTQVDGIIHKVAFKEGQFVKQGQLLFEVDPSPFQTKVDACQAIWARSQAMAKFEVEEARRYQELVGRGGATQREYEQQQSKADAAMAQAKADAASLESAKIDLEHCRVYSPIDGVVGSLSLDVGNTIKSRDLAVTQVRQIQPIYVSFAVPQQNLPEIQEQLKTAPLKVTVCVPGQNSPQGGLVDFVDNTVEAASGTIRLRGTFANADKRLWPGQFVDIHLVVRQLEGAVVIPSRAIQSSQQGLFVYLIGQDNKVHMQPVTPGVAYGENTVIQSGVKAGDLLVLDGQIRLAPDSVVEIKPEPTGKPEPPSASCPAAAPAMAASAPAAASAPMAGAGGR